ncbi:hypothetical protein GpartN1_g7318.t1 [Galdieria partita]|uniref:Zinc finger/thioredoxin putative domain-containing protein n=1 Tax=Galdieria partita TaxID=83374 RepID=A0A9C7Q4W5_9RHOD|nr:hypothetical protein GpartN1_g7318.t1 [Galdieria partita]
MVICCSSGRRVTHHEINEKVSFESTAFICHNNLFRRLLYNVDSRKQSRNWQSRTAKCSQQVCCVLKSNPFFQKLSLIQSLENSLEKMWKKSDMGSLERNWEEQQKRVEYIQCSACKTVYPVKADMFGEKGRYVRCIVCGKLWLQLPQDVKLLEENMETKELSEEDWEQWKLVRMRKMSSYSPTVDSKD